LLQCQIGDSVPHAEHLLLVVEIALRCHQNSSLFLELLQHDVFEAVAGVEAKVLLFVKSCLHLSINKAAVFSVSVVMLFSVPDINLNTLSSMAFSLGWPVRTDTKHLTKGFNSAVSADQIFGASLSTCSTGLFAPRAPSTKRREPMLTASKRLVAEEVARATSRVVISKLVLLGKS
jgi:hypothetical protein